jgi:hypothetical protein
MSSESLFRHYVTAYGTFEAIVSLFLNMTLNFTRYPEDMPQGSVIHKDIFDSIVNLIRYHACQDMTETVQYSIQHIENPITSDLSSSTSGQAHLDFRNNPINSDSDSLPL